MKRGILGIAALFALTGGSAFAADLTPAPAPYYKAPAIAPEPPCIWCGWYIGVNAGGHWDTDQITAAADPVGFTAHGVSAPLFDSAVAGSLHPQGFIGGGQIGYNWQTSNFVFGVEADANGLSGSAARTITGAPLIAAGNLPGDFVSDSAQTRFLATFRGRVGVTFDRVLLYATGGGAWGTVQTTDSFGAFGGTVVSTASNTTSRFGWTVGGGLEYAVTGNWSLKAEYLFVNLGSFNETTAAITGAPSTDITFTHAYTENIARLGVNYRFGGPISTRY
jgi:outer membrane immunogenic protein